MARVTPAMVLSVGRVPIPNSLAAGVIGRFFIGLFHRLFDHGIAVLVDGHARGGGSGFQPRPRRVFSSSGQFVGRYFDQAAGVLHEDGIFIRHTADDEIFHAGAIGQGHGIRRLGALPFPGRPALAPARSASIGGPL